MGVPIRMSTASGFLDSSLSKSAADRITWSLWTMGEDEESQDETDFKPEVKQGSGMSFFPAIRDLQDKRRSTGFSKFNNKGHTEGDRRGSKVESSSRATRVASSVVRGLQRPNSETIFHFE